MTDLTLGTLALIEKHLEDVLAELRKPEKWGAASQLRRMRWDPAGTGPLWPTAEYDYDGVFEAFGVFNLNAASINVALTPNQSNVDTTTLFTLAARGFLILPYKGTTISVSGAAAGSALVVAFDVPQPANAGTF